MTELVLKSLQEQTFFSVMTEQEQKSLINEIICGNELKFNYINGDRFFELIESKGIEIKNLEYLDILKYNYNLIFAQIENYFPDIKINKFVNSPCVNECANFNINNAYIYEIYLVITKEDKIFEYGFDFFSSSDENQENKYEHSKILLDNYEYFYSEDIGSNEDIEYYLDNTLFKLLIVICSILDNEYKLAEILFVKTNKDKMTPKLLKKILGYFTRVIGWNKSNEINLEDLCDNLMIVNNETKKDINLKEFKKIIKSICEKFMIEFDTKQTLINFNIFGKIILHIDSKYYSHILEFYKDIYQHVNEMIPKSLKLIIQLVNEMNMRKKFFSRYISFLIEYKLQDYKNQDIFNKIYLKKINDKKELFEKLLDQINLYCDENKHNEDKLDIIKHELELLYDNIYDV